VGFIFRDFVAKIVNGFRTAGHAVEIVLILAVIVFVGYRVSLFWKHRADRVVPRVHVKALAAKLQAEGPGKYCSQMCAAMVTTVLALSAFPAQFELNPTTSAPR